MSGDTTAKLYQNMPKDYENRKREQRVTNQIESAKVKFNYRKSVKERD